MQKKFYYKTELAHVMGLNPRTLAKIMLVPSASVNGVPVYLPDDVREAIEGYQKWQRKTNLHNANRKPQP